MSNKKRAPKKNPVNYQNGKIYKIVNDTNDMIYVGSTTSTLAKRFYDHKASITRCTHTFANAISEIGGDHFQILLIEPFPCNSKAELLAREYAVMETFSKDKLYNSIIGGKHAPKTLAVLKEKSEGKNNGGFSRGCISQYSCPRSRGYAFSWRSNGKQNGKRITFGTKRTSQEAYMLCMAFRDEIYPLTNEDYLDELPFRE